MEKVRTDWSAYTITTTFLIKLENGVPAVCSSHRGERLYSDPCGLGWRFAILFSSFSQSIMVEFDTHHAHRGLGQFAVTVMLKSADMRDGDCLMREMRTVDAEKRTPIVSWPASSFATHNLLCCEVVLRDPLDIPQSIGIPTSIRHALGESVSSGCFVDTRFFAFSQRSGLGRVSHPLPVYANSALLQEKSTYMETLLSIRGFAESAPGDIQSGFPEGEDPFTDAYGYESDSDLDDMEVQDEIEPAKVDAPELPVSVPTPAPRFERSGRTILIKDMAYRTWRCLIFYLYTGDITFLPLKSDPSRSRNSVNQKFLKDNPTDPPPCSPKSMYRLAEKLGIEPLEKRAFEAIRSGLSENNILEELFSRFTSRYARIHDMQVDLLCREYHDRPHVAEAFSAMMQRVADGEMPHAGAVLSSVFRSLSTRDR